MEFQVVKLKCPYFFPTVGFIIGKESKTIRKLQEMSGAKLRFVQENSEPNSPAPVVKLIITGNPKSIEKAKESVNQILIQSRNSNLPEVSLEFRIWFNHVESKNPESKKEMENENLDSDKKECQNPDGSGDEIAKNTESGARASPER